MALEGVSKCKNHYFSTFASIKKDWCVMWSPRALCWMRTVPKKSPKANSMIQRRTENFFTPLKANAFTHLHAPFALFWCFSEVNGSWRSIKMQKSLCFHVFVNKKWLVRHVITPRTLLDAHGPKEVPESKQYDLTTHRKFFHAPRSQRFDSLTSNVCAMYRWKTKK